MSDRTERIQRSWELVLDANILDHYILNLKWIDQYMNVKSTISTWNFHILCGLVYLYKLVLTTAENWIICLCGVELSYAKFTLRLERLRNTLETWNSEVWQVFLNLKTLRQLDHDDYKGKVWKHGLQFKQCMRLHAKWSIYIYTYMHTH